jgi:pre-mRNA-processing factor 6
VGRAIKKLSTSGVKVKRDQWLREATLAEESGSVFTCRSIIKETLDYGLEEYLEGIATDDEKEKVKVIKRVWTENAEACVEQGAFETARALYFQAIKRYPHKKSLWFNAIKFEE